MVQPGRSWKRKEKSRFGFNGQEYDSDLEWVSFRFLEHDPKLGRFASVDPIAAKYPMYSPYHFSSNQPIHAAEWEGLESRNDLNSSDPNFTNASPEGKKQILSAQAPIAIGMVIVGLDVTVTGGYLSFGLGLYNLGNWAYFSQKADAARRAGNTKKQQEYGDKAQSEAIGMAFDILGFGVCKGFQTGLKISSRWTKGTNTVAKDAGACDEFIDTESNLPVAVARTPSYPKDFLDIGLKSQGGFNVGDCYPAGFKHKNG